MRDWFDLLVQSRAEARPHVIVTVTEAKGSAPREAGAKMVVTEDQSAGTIGGGNLEFKAIDRARDLIAKGETAPQFEDFPLGPALGQCCGGHVTLLYESFPATRFHLALFGAGHVANALMRVLDGTDCRIHWIDSRDQSLPAAPPDFVETLPSDDPAGEIGLLPKGAHVLVMTHSHQQDFDIIEAALRRGDFASIGVIGSDSKWAGFRRRLIEKGLPAEQVDAVRCPIGIAGINGKRPAQIAIAVAAQLLKDQGEQEK